jgi:hypothetical protein
MPNELDRLKEAFFYLGKLIGDVQNHNLNLHGCTDVDELEKAVAQLTNLVKVRLQAKNIGTGTVLKR